jgi:hypothetical protein
MSLPSPTDPIWSDLVSGRAEIPFEFLAAKMLIVRLRMAMHEDSSPASVVRCALQLHQLYADNSALPSAQRDIARLGAARQA